jgi:AAHS family 4-hydroxybenzoate transporter-like MFS transporter
MDKINPNKVVAVGWLLTGVCVCLVGFSTSSLVLMGVMVFIAGSIMNGAQSSMPRWRQASTRRRGAHRRRLDAGYRPLRRDPRRVQRRLPDAGAALLETIFTLLAIPAFLSALALLTGSVNPRRRRKTTREVCRKPDC